MGKVAKLMFAAHAREGMNRHEATAYLRDHHGPLVAETPTNRRRLKTYIQNYAIDTQGVAGATLRYDWIIESWRDLTVVLPEPPTAPDAMRLRDDEARFPDRSTVLTLQVVEEPVWPDVPVPFDDAPIKVFTYARRRPDLSASAFAALWPQRAALLAGQSAFQRHARSFVRNRPVPGAGANADPTHAPSAAVEPPYDGVDIWRFASVDDAVAMFGDGCEKLISAYCEELFDPESVFRLVTSEKVVFDDAGVVPQAGN